MAEWRRCLGLSPAALQYRVEEHWEMGDKQGGSAYTGSHAHTGSCTELPADTGKGAMQRVLGQKPE